MSDRRGTRDAVLAEAADLTRTLLPQINDFRLRQRDDGTVADPSGQDVQSLRTLSREAARWYHRHGRTGQADALVADAEDWLSAGLDTPPHFARSRDALTAPADGDWAALLAPILTTNSAPPVGKRLEFFLARRQEPDALGRLATRFPHPKNNCQATVLLAGSEGFTRGNCIVFFPENVAAHDRVRSQAYAIFFFSKFRKIHETFAVPAAESVLTADSMPRSSSGMAPGTCYQARSIWGYLHDYFHHQGRWPLDRHLKLKTNWFVGLLEETKVDAQTVLACRENGIPYAQEQIDMILLERIFRYPLADDAVRNFDSGTGVFLFSWLRAHGVLTDQSGSLRLRRDRVFHGLRELVAAIEDMEAGVTTPGEYRAAARAFVRRFLPEGKPGDRYGFTDDQLILLRARGDLASLPTLGFGLAEL
ncbi:DUF6421 family protein [Streptomyces gobiensis]|uniref:DUF6421 family protein n=1 Tax=Streptomyces gobiensis TaxID=2875706 RepID=UPI001E535EF5|nr:DUF6421 family protein [Streptomyces gobiensis]UGY94582.1 DUF6421 family protein [Streptomyces gobiensis]